MILFVKNLECGFKDYVQADTFRDEGAEAASTSADFGKNACCVMVYFPPVAVNRPGGKFSHTSSDSAVYAWDDSWGVDSGWSELDPVFTGWAFGRPFPFVTVSCPQVMTKSR